MKVARTPLFFGPHHRSLFGWFHAPAEDECRDLAVVVCPPVGHEYVNSHRPMRHLADRLAEAGVSVLRFEYDGTGDSAGSDEDPSRVSAWTQSVHTAIETLRELSGCDRIGLVGVRLGATIAFAVAAQIEIDFLVLWAPCVRGRAYAREMRALHLTAAKFNASSGAGHIEPGGFVFTDETQRDIGCLDLDGVTPKTKRALIVTRDDLAADTRFRDKWIGAGIVTELRAVPGFTEMLLPPHSAVTPERAIAETVDWIVSGAAQGRSKPSSLRRRCEQRISEGEPPVEIRESIVYLEDRLFGILSESVKPVNDGRLTILLPNAGSAHHVGPNRLYVQLTRRLASAGFRCFRFDLPGLGDNVVRDVAQENQPYLSTSSSVVATAMEAMRQQRNSDVFMLMGLCSGAHTSFHATLDLDHAPIVESILINPLTFYYRHGMPLDVLETAPHVGWKRSVRSIAYLERWAKRLRSYLRIALFRLCGIHPTTALALRKMIDDAPLHNLEVDLRRIIDSGRKLTFVFSRFDPGYDLLMINAARAVNRSRKKGLIRLWQIDDANHTFEARRSREVMIDSVVRHLRDRYAV